MAALAPALLKAYLARYDTIVDQGLSVNPTPRNAERDYLERKAYNLVAALKKLKPEATRFATDLQVRSGTSNALVESMKTKIRVLTRVAFGFRSPEALIAMAMLAVGGVYRLYAIRRGERPLIRAVGRVSH